MFKKAVLICSTLTTLYASAQESVTIVRPKGSEIESITVKGNDLILKSKNRKYQFKLTELIDRPEFKMKVKKVIPKSVDEAFKYYGKWYFFNAPKNLRCRLNYRHKPGYKTFKEGELLQRTFFKGKYYARDLDKTTYVPTFEIKNDFRPHLIPANDYVKQVADHIKAIKDKIAELKKDIPKAEIALKADHNFYLEMLTKNNLTIESIDKKGNIIKSGSTGEYSSKIRKELRNCYKDLKKKGKAIKAAQQTLVLLKNNLAHALDFQKKIKILYDKHVAPKK